jgi:hypothetical protein
MLNWKLRRAILASLTSCAALAPLAGQAQTTSADTEAANSGPELVARP